MIDLKWMDRIKDCMTDGLLTDRLIDWLVGLVMQAMAQLWVA